MTDFDKAVNAVSEQCGSLPDFYEARLAQMQEMPPAKCLLIVLRTKVMSNHNALGHLYDKITAKAAKRVALPDFALDETFEQRAKVAETRMKIFYTMASILAKRSRERAAYETKSLAEKAAASRAAGRTGKFMAPIELNGEENSFLVTYYDMVEAQLALTRLEALSNFAADAAEAKEKEKMVAAIVDDEGAAGEKQEIVSDVVDGPIPGETAASDGSGAGGGAENAGDGNEEAATETQQPAIDAVGGDGVATEEETAKGGRRRSNRIAKKTEN